MQERSYIVLLTVLLLQSLQTLRAQLYSQCGGTLSSPTGVIQSPNYPYNYPAGSWCTWLISAELNQRIQLTFDSFSLEAGAQCSYDSVEIRNGNTLAAPLIGKYCGVQTPRVIVSDGNQLWIRFKADGSGHSSGFSARYTAIDRNPANTTVIPCSATFTTKAGNISKVTPPYDPRDTCDYLIDVDCLGRIRVDIQGVYTSGDSFLCVNGYLELHDGDSQSAPLLGSRYCISGPAPTMYTSSNKLFIRYDSGAHQYAYLANARRSFSLNYTAECIDTRECLKRHLELEIRTNASEPDYVEPGDVYQVECDTWGTPSPNLTWRWKACTKADDCTWSEDLSEFQLAQMSWGKMRVSSLTTTAKDTRTIECMSSNSFGNTSTSITFFVTDVPSAKLNHGFAVKITGDTKRNYYCADSTIVFECLTQQYLYTGVYWSKWLRVGGEDPLRDTTGPITQANSSRSLSNVNSLTISKLDVNAHSGIYFCNALFNRTTMVHSMMHIAPIPVGVQDCTSPAIVVVQSSLSQTENALVTRPLNERQRSARSSGQLVVQSTPSRPATATDPTKQRQPPKNKGGSQMKPAANDIAAPSASSQSKKSITLIVIGTLILAVAAGVVATVMLRRAYARRREALFLRNDHSYGLQHRASRAESQHSLVVDDDEIDL